MLTHIEVPLLVQQIERAIGSSNISSENQCFLAEFRSKLFASANKTQIKAMETARLDDIFRETGMYHIIGEDGGV